jgi:hypothetical protein
VDEGCKDDGLNAGGDEIRWDCGTHGLGVGLSVFDPDRLMGGAEDRTAVFGGGDDSLVLMASSRVRTEYSPVVSAFASSLMCVDDHQDSFSV